MLGTHYRLQWTTLFSLLNRITGTALVLAAAMIVWWPLAAKEQGVYKGRKPKIDSVEVRRLHFEGELSPSAIAKRLRIARSSVYRFLPEVGQTNP